MTKESESWDQIETVYMYTLTDDRTIVCVRIPDQNDCVRPHTWSTIVCVRIPDQRLCASAYLIYGIFVIGFEFIEGDNVPNGEEDEEGGKDEGDDVTKCGESERHLYTRVTTA